MADRGTTFRYGCQLRTKRTLVVWRISSGDLQRQCHQSVEVVVGWHCLLQPSIHMLYDDTVTWRVWAAKKAQLPPLPCSQVLNQRLGEGHPDRKARRAVVLGWMQSEPCERPAVYPAFALRATRGSSSLEDQTSSFMALRNLRVACQKRRRCRSSDTSLLQLPCPTSALQLAHLKLLSRSSVMHKHFQLNSLSLDTLEFQAQGPILPSLFDSASLRWCLSAV